MVNKIFTVDDPEVQKSAWTSLYRWYGRLGYGMGPLVIKASVLEHFFGSVIAFPPIFAKFLSTDATRELFVRDHLAQLLRYAEPDILPALAAKPRVVGGLVDALEVLLKDPSQEFTVRLAAIDFLALLAGEEKFRAKIQMLLFSFRGTDLNLASTTALERIKASVT